MRFQKVDKKEEVIFSNRDMTVGDFKDMIKDIPDHIKIGRFETKLDSADKPIEILCGIVYESEIVPKQDEEGNEVYLKMSFNDDLI